MAGLFLAREPSRVSGIVPQLGTSAAARQAVGTALRYDNSLGSGRVYASLCDALNDGAPVSAASHAAGLSLAIRHPPGRPDAASIDDLAGRLALVLADRVTATNGPALGVTGLRDAVEALAEVGRPGQERHLLTALHSSSFQVRLSVALALIRRGRWELIERSVESWIAQAESPERTGVQHQLGLALWFCPHLASTDPAAGMAFTFAGCGWRSQPTATR